MVNPTTVTVCLFSKDPKPKVKTLLNANGIDFVTKVSEPLIMPVTNACAYTITSH